MKTQEIKDMAKALATMRESAKTRALASVKAQPKDKVSLAPAPWDKKKSPKDESLDYNPSKGEYNQKPGKEVGKKVGTREDASNDKSDDGEGLDKVDTKATKKKFANRKDKDIDNDGDTDSSDEYLHKRRKAISKSVKEASLDEASKEGTIKIIKTKDNMFQVQRMTKGKFVDQGKPHKSAKDAEKVRSSGQDTMQFEAVLLGRDYEVKDGNIHITKAKLMKVPSKKKYSDGSYSMMHGGKLVGVTIVKESSESEHLEEMTAAERKLISQMYDKKGNLTPMGKKVMDHGKAASKLTLKDKDADTARRKEYNAYQKSKRNEEVEAIDEIGDTSAGKKRLKNLIVNRVGKVADAGASVERNPAKAGEYDKAQKRHMKTVGRAAGRLAKESVEVDEAKTDVYHKLMLKALGKTKLPKGHGNTSSVANNGDFVVADGGGRVIGRLKKGEFVLPSKNESVEVAEVTIAKSTHTPNNGSPRGEGLSPNAKDQLKTANDTVDDEVDGPLVNKKSFDAMRASLKTAPKRNADNDTGDKVIVKGGK